MSAPEIVRTLVLSTAHLTEHTCVRWLEEAPFAVYPKGEYGWFVYVADDVDMSWPADLRACLEFARRCKCAWIMFDCDAPAHERADLPAHDW